MRASRLARLSAIQRRFNPLPIDEAVATSYARLAAQIACRLPPLCSWQATIVAVGRQPRARVIDLLIAATAHAHGAAVYTRNAEDLAGLTI